MCTEVKKKDLRDRKSTVTVIIATIAKKILYDVLTIQQNKSKIRGIIVSTS